MRHRTESEAVAASLTTALLGWYVAVRRTLPWREPDCSAWGVLVSEVMLQQTPVVRVLPVWEAWMARWSTPAALASEPPGEAIALWGRLGYPRRALRLHAAAACCVAAHQGSVPRTYDELRALPGVGDYTAAAVAAFAFRQRHVVLDTNVRRVLARLVGGEMFEPAGSPTTAERDRAAALLPVDADTSATWNVALMELGALVCTARSPRCDICPVASMCAWRLAGSPPWQGPARHGQTYEGTDRQVRGRLLAVVRDHNGPVPATELAAVGGDAGQRARALESLVADGLVEPVGTDAFGLPGRPS